MRNTKGLLSRVAGRVSALMVLALTGMAASSFGQPVNDSYYSPQMIGGVSGLVNGTNFNATAQFGEPNHLPGSGFTDNASVWYGWTAPGSGITVFDIPVSSNFLSGVSLDTVMAVYAVSNGMFGPVFTTITNNDDSGPYTFNSRCTFNAVGGALYYIAVDSWEGSGSFELQWTCATNNGGGLGTLEARKAGNFQFTTNRYGSYSYSYSTNGGTVVLLNSGASFVAGDMDSYTLGSTTTMDSYEGARVTVTRVGGASGRVLVDYVVTNRFYDVESHTNVMVQTTTNSDGSIGIAVSAEVAQHYPVDTGENRSSTYGYNYSGGYNPQAWIHTIYSNFPTMYFGATTDPAVIRSNMLSIGEEYSVVAGSKTAYIGTAPNLARGQWTTGTMATNVTLTIVSNRLVYVTNVFDNSIIKLPAAYPMDSYLGANVIGIGDYMPSTGTLVFDDFQMSKDIIVPVGYSSYNGILDDNYILGEGMGSLYSSLYGYHPGQNAVFEVVLSNPRFDPLESLDPSAPNVVTDIEPPTIDPYYSTAVVKVLDSSVEAGFGVPGGDKTTGPPWAPPFQGPDYTHPTQLWPIINIERATYRCDSSVGTVVIWLTRNGSSKGGVTVKYHTDWDGIGSGRLDGFAAQAGSEYAVPDEDFATADGTVSWGDNDTRDKAVSITIMNTNGVQFDRDFIFQLEKNAPNDPYYLGNISVANVTIEFKKTWGDPQPAGAVDRTYNPDFKTNSAFNYSDGSLEFPPMNANPGANKPVYSMAMQPDGKVVIGGAFTALNGSPVKRVARMLANGWPDLDFNPGDGANDSVTALNVDNNGNIVIGGQFTSINGINAPHIARLNASGGFDGSFNPGLGANGQIWSIAFQADGKILVGGDFTTFNGTNRNHIARLDRDGALDVSFDPGTGPDSSVFAVVPDLTGGVIIGGAFTSVNGVGMSSIARLTANGSLDTRFTVGAGGIDGPVRCLAVQPNGAIVVGGAFSQINIQPRSCIARLKTNGQLDDTFDPGTGADGTVYSLVLQPDGCILAGGMFTKYNYVRRMGIVRLFSDGSVDTSFMDTAYNQFAGVPNHYANPDAFNPNDIPGSANTRNSIFAMALDQFGNVMIGGSFAQVGGGLTRDDIRNRANVARLVGGATPGPGNVSFMQPVYAVDENAGYLYVSLTRTNGTLGMVGVTFGTNFFAQGPGAAKPSDFTLDSAYTAPKWGTWYYGTAILSGAGMPHPRYGWRWSDGYWGPNYSMLPGRSSSAHVYLGIVDNTVVDGNRTAQLVLGPSAGYDQLFLGGENIPTYPALGRAKATLQIVDNDYRAGTLVFTATNYNVIENAGSVTLTVTRTNGSTGVVTVDYSTINGTATNKIDYTAVSGRLSFADGVLNQTITIPIRDNTLAQPDRFFSVALTNATGTAALDSTNRFSTVTIIDNDFQEGHISFAAPVYTVSELSTTAVIRVARTGGSSKSLTVQCAATNSTAINGVNFVGVTNTLSWDSGDISDRFLYVPIIRDNAVTSDLAVNLRLFNPIIANNPSDPDTGGVIGYGQVTNAVLSIVNQDFYGNLEFSSSSYNVMENAGYATVTVFRKFGSVGTISVGVMTGDGTAVSGLNYSGVTNRLTFGPGETSKSLIIPIIDNLQVNSSRNFRVLLVSPSPAGILNAPGVNLLTLAKVTIIDDETVNEPAGSVDPTFKMGAGFDAFVSSLAQQPDGMILVGGDFRFIGQTPRNRIARLQADGTVDLGFLTFMDGADGTVRSVVSQTPGAGQSNGPILIGGSFNKVNGVFRHSIARLYQDGALDETFDPGAGADGPIFAMAEVIVPNGTNFLRKALIAGGFTRYNSIARNGIARVNDDGTLDTTFDPANGVGGTNGTIFSLALQNDGQVLVGGDFTQFADTSHSHLARLTQSGAVDPAFNPAIDGSVRTIVVQPDGKILIGGLFKTVNNVALNHLARLNQDGSVDRTFQVGDGANDTVLTLALDSSGKILVGGEFIRASSVTRHRLTRLNPDGTVDPGINFGDGADGFVSAILFQDDGKMVVGGGFKTFNWVSSPGLVRLFGGALAGSGKLQFDKPLYTVDENGTNVVINVRRMGGTFSSTNNGDLSVDVATADGPAITGLGAGVANVDYLSVPNHLDFPAGETFKTIFVPIVNNFVLDGDRSFFVYLTNYSVADAVGAQPTAAVRINDDETGISFSSPVYRVIENIPSGTARIDITRSGNSNTTVSVDVVTTTNGTAMANVRYAPVTNTVVFAPGQNDAVVFVPIINDYKVIGDQTVVLGFTNVNGAVRVEPTKAVLTIVEDDTAPGMLIFSTNVFYVGEADGSAFVQVLRTNGATGTITVDYATTNGTAIGGSRYYPTNGSLAFADGETSKLIKVAIIDDVLVQGNQNFFVKLSNPGGGAQISDTNSASVVIIDNDLGFGFSQPNYSVDEAGGSVTLLVNRMGDSNAVLTVDYATKDGTALANTNYLSASNTLKFASGEMTKSITIPILRDQVVAGNLNFSVVLSNPAGRPGVQLTQPASAAVIIVDADSGFRFSTNSYVVAEGGTNGTGTNAVITVFRYGSVSKSNSISFATADGTANSGIRYIATNGVLVFKPNVITNTFSIPIINDQIVEGDQTANIVLYNPTGGAQLIQPNEAVLTILDDDANLSFSTASYTMSECDQRATITVVRSGLTNNALSVAFATSDGTGKQGQNYVATNGTLLFQPGQITNTFVVQAIDDSLINGDTSIQLTLSSPTGGANLQYPSFATLTMKECDGTLVVPAGMAIVSEPAATRNGVIDTNETVTVRLGLRSLSGVTGNLVATLQASNGITGIVTPSQTYGWLQEGGHAVSMPFTFTASGTNGQTVSAVLVLTNDLGTKFDPVAFKFTMGQLSRSYTNVTPIHIADNTNASPYPSVIPVSEVLGTVGHVSVTLLGVTHTYPDDINVLLSGPSGSNTLLMSHCGGAYPINNLALTFDDLAKSVLPDTGLMYTSTNKPTTYNPIYRFMGAAPLRPFGTTLSVFNNTAINGPWSLWVEDDRPQDTGDILNGWILTLTSGMPVSSVADMEVTLTGPANGVINNLLTNVVTVTNYGPGDATGIFFTNVIPAGLTFSNCSRAYTLSNGNLIVSLPNMAVGQGVSFTLGYVPNSSGLLTNSVSVGADESDLNTGNNAVASITKVAQPNADLSVTLADAPDPLSIGDLLTYTITIVNKGPSKATGVMLTNWLPEGMVLTVAPSTPAGSFITNDGTVLVAPVGDLQANDQAVVTFSLRVIAGGLFTDSAYVSSSVVDPRKGDNYASVKTVVIGAPSMTLSPAASGFMLTWPVGGSYILESTTSLTEPVQWQAVPNSAAVVVGDHMAVPVTVSNQATFFRLRLSLP